MRAIVLYQPYAWAMFHGKDFENRSWSTRHRGPLGILAGLNRKKYEEGARELRARGLEPPPSVDLDYGGLIGAVDVWDVVAPTEGTLLPPSGHLWHFQSQFGWRTRTPVELPFRSLRGHQGFVEVELTPAEQRRLELGGLLVRSPA